MNNSFLSMHDNRCFNPELLYTCYDLYLQTAWYCVPVYLETHAMHSEKFLTQSNDICS